MSLGKNDEAIVEYKRDLNTAVRDRQKKTQQGRQAQDRPKRELEKQIALYVDAIGDGGLRD